MRIICTTNNVGYSTIRWAMSTGARTKEDLKEAVDVCLLCEGCQDLERILTIGCSCEAVLLADIIKAVQDGADSVYEVSKRTDAASECGRCRPLVENVIEKKA